VKVLAADEDDTNVGVPVEPPIERRCRVDASESSTEDENVGSLAAGKLLLVGTRHVYGALRTGWWRWR
jgi:hypothetical protein